MNKIQMRLMDTYTYHIAAKRCLKCGNINLKHEYQIILKKLRILNAPANLFYSL